MSNPLQGQIDAVRASLAALDTLLAVFSAGLEDADAKRVAREKAKRPSEPSCQECGGTKFVEVKVMGLARSDALCSQCNTPYPYPVDTSNVTSPDNT